MNSEITDEMLELEILKVNHDEVLDKLLKKYPLEDGYDVEVISCKPIDSRTESVVIKITNKKIQIRTKNI